MEGSLPDPPPGARNLVVVVVDSLRYDSWIEAQPQTLAALGPVECRWSYATWTAPSHYNLLMGLFPHTARPRSTRRSTTRRTSAATATGSASRVWSSARSSHRSSNTWVAVTSDHGELFGEDRYFGHGPVQHEKVLEVPFVEGPAP